MAKQKMKNTSLATIKLWLKYASEKQWEKMVELCQLTWLVNITKEQVIEYIESLYDRHENINWTTIQQIENAKCKKRYQVTIITSEGIYQMTPNVICETAPFTPNLKGTWGINPISAMLKKVEGK